MAFEISMIIALSIGAVLLTVICFSLLILRLSTRRKHSGVGDDQAMKVKLDPKAELGAAPTSIDLERLTFEALAPQAPRIDLYGTRTQWVVFVLAPAGRGTDFPDQSHWHELVDGIAPGLSKVLDYHRPTFRRWPEQVSQHGFVHAFFNAMRAADSKEPLGDSPANAPPMNSPQGPRRFYRLAGKVEWRGVPILVGMVLMGHGPEMGFIEVDHAGKWLDLIKVKA